MNTSRTAFFVMIAAMLTMGAAATGQILIPYGSAGWEYSLPPHASWTPNAQAPWGDWEPDYGNVCKSSESVLTKWPVYTDIRVRRTITLCAGATGLSVATKIDNDIQVFWNGTDITGIPSPKIHDGCAEIEPFTFAIDDGSLNEGANLLEVHGFDRGLISFLDIEVSGDVGDCTPDPPIVCGTATPSADELWPPNHKYRTINVEGVVDANNNAAAITITSIHQDESVLAKGGGAGNTCPDATGVGTSNAQVRAERNGNPNTPGNGRVYTINFTATGSNGETCGGTVRTCVPHDQGQGPGCVDDGPLYISTVCP